MVKIQISFDITCVYNLKYENKWTYLENRSRLPDIGTDLRLPRRRWSGAAWTGSSGFTKANHLCTRTTESFCWTPEANTTLKSTILQENKVVKNTLFKIKAENSLLFFGRNDAKAETPVLWPPHAKSWLIGNDPDAGRDWGQEEKVILETFQMALLRCISLACLVFRNSK